MRPVPIPNFRPRSTGIAVLCLLFTGCGQTGALYLVAPRTTVPRATTHTAPEAVTYTRPPSAATHGQL